MSKKIAIIDYSLGNLFSVQQAFAFCGATTFVTNEASEIASADAIVLPGVGAFNAAMNYLQEHKLDLAIKDAVNSDKPFLGICLGMQLLFNSSEEFGATKGLGIIDGEIKKFMPLDLTEKLHVPQVGWNTLKPQEGRSWKGTPLETVEENSFMYFVHSYYAVPAREENILSKTTYGGLEYCSAVIKNNAVATQFHPEKSGESGLSIYKNWLNNI